MIDRMDVGDEYVYRLKDDSSSERVRIVSLGPPKQHRRIVVEFVGGSQAGRTEDVPVRRLKVPWSEVEKYDRDFEVWTRFSAMDFEAGEEMAVRRVFRTLLPENIARQDMTPADFTTTVVDEPELANLLGVPAGRLLADFEFVTVEGGLPVVSAMATLFICEMACRHNPLPVLDDLRERETKAMIHSKTGHEEWGQGRGHETFTADEDHDYYINALRPEFELLRQWCGSRAVSFQERMIAAEQESHRLDEILVKALERLLELEGETRQWKQLRDDFVNDRITPDKVRPIVERPLGWWDCPEPPGSHRRGRWW